MRNDLLPRAARGVLGGLVATLAMSSAMYAAKRFGLLGEPPPRKITRALLHVVGLRPRRSTLNFAAMAMHLGFGASMGGIYGVAQARRIHPALAAGAGLGYGGLIWASSYAGWVPALAIMPRPTWDRPGRPTAMVAAHGVYGLVLAEIVNALQTDARAARVARPSRDAGARVGPGGDDPQSRASTHPVPPLRSAAAELPREDADDDA